MDLTKAIALQLVKQPKTSDSGLELQQKHLVQSVIFVLLADLVNQ
jgi:hypothetical protein